MYHTIEIQPLSKSQISKLLNGHRVIVKSGQGIEIHASEEQYKKILKAHQKGSGVTIRFDPYQMQNHQFLRGQKGKGFFDSIKKVISNPAVSGIVKTITPIAANLVSQQVKNLTGSDAAADISKTLVNAGSNSLQSQSQTSGNGFNLHSIGLGINPTRGKLGGALLPAGYGIYPHPRKAGRPKKNK